MTSDVLQTAGEENLSIRNPWPTIVFGLACCTSAVGVSAILQRTGVPEWWPGFSALAVLVGLVSAGFGVSVRPRSAVVLFSAGITAFLGWLALDESWDTARQVAMVLTVVPMAAAAVVLLPSAGRRIVVSALILLHFGAITVSVMSPIPDSTPWLARQLHVRFYRPYQEFMYLVNAYHFYAPEPGPPNLVWFCIEYEDSPKRWIKIPNRQTDAKDLLSVEFYRRLSLAENVSQNGPPLPFVPDDILRARNYAGQVKGIPLYPNLAYTAQYRPPSPLVRQMLPSYVRFVARTYKNEKDPELRVVGVKVYHVVHYMLTAGDMAENADPLDKSLFQPFFLGEFDAGGIMKNQAEFDPNGEVVKQGDPLLYWHIPIFYAPRNKQFKPGEFRLRIPVDRKERERDYELKDYLKVHAQSDPWGDEQP